MLRTFKPNVFVVATGPLLMVLSACGGLGFNKSAIITKGSGAGSSTAVLSQISCGTQSLTGAQSKACTVHLTANTKKAIVVALKSSSTALAVPSSVTVSAGAASAGFNAVASTVSQPVSVTLTGSAERVKKTDIITLYPAPASIALSKVSCGISKLTGPATASCSVYLSGAASSATVVTLSSNNASLEVQPSVTVTQGSSTAGFVVTALAVLTTQSATLTGKAGSVSESDVLELVSSAQSSQPTQHNVDLTWNAPASSPEPVAGYNIYRAIAGLGYQRVNSAVEVNTNYKDSAVQSGLTYDYFVKSVDGAGVESAPSNQTSVTIP